jgi:hypothetical protein
MPKSTTGIAVDRWIRGILVERNTIGVATFILLYRDLVATDLKLARVICHVFLHALVVFHHPTLRTIGHIMYEWRDARCSLSPA